MLSQESANSRSRWDHHLLPSQSGLQVVKHNQERRVWAISPHPLGAEIIELRQWISHPAQDANIGDHVTIRHTIAKLVNVATLTTNRVLGTVLAASSINHAAPKHTHCFQESVV